MCGKNVENKNLKGLVFGKVVENIAAVYSFGIILLA